MGSTKISSEPPQTKERRAELKWTGPTLSLLLQGFHTPAFSTKNVDLPACTIRLIVPGQPRLGQRCPSRS